MLWVAHLKGIIEPVKMRCNTYRISLFSRKIIFSLLKSCLSTPMFAVRGPEATFQTMSWKNIFGSKKKSTRRIRRRLVGLEGA
jgi:hypothetical protein